jgi:predicted transposase/invertase (TIGR01784 family)
MSLGDQWRSVMLDYQVWKMDRWGEEEQIRLDKEQHKLDLEEARRKAMAEGHAEGVAENKLEIARKMKAIGWPESEIAEVTGLTVEEVIRC